MAAEAHLIFVNGFGLEVNLLDALTQAAPEVPLVSLSEGIQGISFDQGTVGERGHTHTAEVDPHVWFDPAKVKTWVQNAAEALSACDPAHAAIYQAHAQAYLADLEELDAWIQSRVQDIPQEKRLLVTDHNVFQYFAARYSFEIVGAVIPAYSSTASVSAQEIADLIDVIEETNVPAVFVGLTVNPRLAESIARDTGAAVVPLYTGSLSETGGRADSYLEMMRANVSAIVEALK
jgi:ABC-type Zn uptake system ZnuABC Zn-binding protein ZnuA